MVERLPQHRHCDNCDRAIPYKDQFCSEECEKDFKSKLGRKRRQLMFFYIVMVAIFGISVAMIFLRR